MRSKRRLAIPFAVSETSGQSKVFDLTVTNLPIPDSLPSELFNSFRFNLLRTDSSLVQVTHFSSLYDAPRTVLQLNTQSYQFSWRIKQLDLDSQVNFFFPPSLLYEGPDLFPSPCRIQ